MTKKMQKRLSKKCPECKESLLIVVLVTEEIDGVEYDTSYIECEICGYEELYRDYR